MSKTNIITNARQLAAQYKYVYLPNVSFYKSWRFYVYVSMLITSMINFPLAIRYDLFSINYRRPVVLLMVMDVVVSIFFIINTIRRKVKIRTWRRPDDIIKSPEKRVLIGYPIAALVIITINIFWYYFIFK